MIAAAEFGAPILSAQDWRAQYEQRWGASLPNARLVPYLKRLVADKAVVGSLPNDAPAPIFVRENSGVFRFLDPRMPSYIRLALSGAVNGFATVSPDTTPTDGEVATKIAVGKWDWRNKA